MGIILLCRFIRNVSTIVMIAGFLTDFRPGIFYGAGVFLATLAISHMMIEGFFVTAFEQVSGEMNGQKPSGEVGRSDVSKAGSRGEVDVKSGTGTSETSAE